MLERNVSCHNVQMFRTVRSVSMNVSKQKKNLANAVNYKVVNYNMVNYTYKQIFGVTVTSSSCLNVSAESL